MPRFLISFDDGSMDHIQDDLEEVGAAAHAVMRAAKEAGVWVTGGGMERQVTNVVAVDGTVTDGPSHTVKPVVGGFSLIDTDSREQALVWAARFAAACRCPQEVREVMFDPEV